MWKMSLGSDEPTKKNHQTLQFPSALQSITAFLVFTPHNFTVFICSHCSRHCCLSLQRAAVFSEKALETHGMLPSQHQQTEIIGRNNYLVNIMEHIAAKEPDISFRSWWILKTELKGMNIGLTSSVSATFTISAMQSDSISMLCLKFIVLCDRNNHWMQV